MRRAINLLLTFAILVSLCACGGQSASTSAVSRTKDSSENAVAASHSPSSQTDDAGNSSAQETSGASGTSKPETSAEVDAQKRVFKTIEKWTDGRQNGYLSDRISYNRDGQVVKVENFYMEGTAILSMVECEIDSHGRTIKQTTYDGSGQITQQWYSEVEYDAADHCTSMKSYRDGTLSSWVEYEYNEAGYLTKQISVNPETGSRFVPYEYEYDTAGNRIKMTRFSSDGTMGRVTEYEYDSNNNKVKELEYYQGQLDGGKMYIYNEFGNIIEEQQYNRDQGVFLTRYKYECNSSNQIIGRFDYGWGDEKASSLAVYDATGHENSDIMIDFGNNCVDYSFDCNSNGFIETVRWSDSYGAHYQCDWEYNAENYLTRIRYPSSYSSLDSTMYYNSIEYVYEYWD